jgi:hypothetical protein
MKGGRGIPKATRGTDREPKKFIVLQKGSATFYIDPDAISHVVELNADRFSLGINGMLYEFNGSAQEILKAIGQ